MNFLITLLIGGLAGWLSGLATGKSRSVIMNIILGLVGGFIANFLNLGGDGFFTKVIISAIFATIFVFVAGLFTKNQ
jgi:uncharacterized membrane protein YeaQ/YmgE (transglycosylase-associated protein family)